MSIMQDIRFYRHSFQFKGFTYLYPRAKDVEEDENNFSALDEEWVEDYDNEDGST